MNNNDLILQFIFCIVGVILGLIAQILKPPQQKKMLGGLALILLFIAAGWFGYNYLNIGGLDNPQAEANGVIWNVTFFGNQELKPPIVLETFIKGSINGLRVDWGVGAPRIGMPTDHFSAEFTTTQNFNAGLYCFVLTVDDGGRLFIDGKTIREAFWGYTPEAVYKNKVTLDQGQHTIKLQYFDENDKAAFHIFWYTGGVGSECVTIDHPGIQ